MKVLLLIIGITLSTTLARSQSFLSLQKPMNYRNLIYKEGDFIRVQLKSNKKYQAGQINWFNDTILMLEGSKSSILINDVAAVIRGPERGGLVIAAPKTLLMASAIFLLADLFNSRFQPTPSTFYITGAIALSSLLFRPFKYRKHSYKNGWRLYYFDKEKPVNF